MDLDTLIIFDASGLFSLLRWLTWTHLPFLFFSGAQSRCCTHTYAQGRRVIRKMYGM